MPSDPRDDAPPPVQPDPRVKKLPCPHCGKDIVVHMHRSTMTGDIAAYCPMCKNNLVF